jgi:hypothetical protein
VRYVANMYILYICVMSSEYSLIYFQIDGKDIRRKKKNEKNHHVENNIDQTEQPWYKSFI